MSRKKKQGALTKPEKGIVKALLLKGWRNQDIQALINIGRAATINSARITGVKQDSSQKPSTDDQVEFYKIKKRSYDPKTGLNLFDDERLIRAREAMILGVQVFNSAGLNFKTEVFSVLANIAWTYLLHEFYERKSVSVIQSDGRSLLLGQMLEKADCPLSDGTKNNLKALKIIRDDVEHKVLGRADLRWYSLFQACCLNFDKALCNLFGEQLTLANELAFALQFAKMNVDQLATVNKYEIPRHIDAIDARLSEDLDDTQINDLEYQFRVIFTLDAASKGRSHFEFVRPESVEGKEIKNVLVQYRAADHLYPYKPKAVVALVQARAGKAFTLSNHTQSWKLFKARPNSNNSQPENTNKDFCIYHPAHRDYTYSDAWVEKLANEVADKTKFDAIKAVK